MKETTRTRRPLRLAIIGDPVEHSQSPALHRGFLAEAGLSGTYEAIRVGAGEGARAVDLLRAREYTGLNVTTPLKEEAYARAERRDAVAEATGAVNTLVLGVAFVAGYNTDGAGALAALGDAGLADVAGARILVLGAGPTARATVAALVGARADVVVWNRTSERAEAVVAALGGRVWREADESQTFDAAFATLTPHALVPAGVLAALARTPAVADANYGPRATLAATLGRDDVRDGLAMLRASARASFEIFRSSLA